MGVPEYLITAILTAIGGSIVVATLLYAAIWALRNPEKIEKWWRLSEGPRRILRHSLAHSIARRAFRRSCKEPIERTNREVQGEWPKKIVIRFVDPKQYGQGFIEGKPQDGEIIITKAWDGDLPQNCQAITYAYFKDGTYQKLRHFVNAEYIEGLHLALTMSTLGLSKKKAPLNSFLKEKIIPLMKQQKSDSVRSYFRSFRDLDGAGLLTTILARELCFLETKVREITDSHEVDHEARSLLIFLEKLRHKKKGERVELTFEGSVVSFSVIPVGSPFTKIFGETPYVNRIRKCFEDNIKRVYLWGVGESNLKMVDDIAGHDFKGTLTTKILKDYHSTALEILPSVIVRLDMK